MFFGGDPFTNFAGTPKGKVSGIDVDTIKLYETLEVSKEADAKDIKKAYRKLAVVHHPDKGGNEHQFKEINAAYEILSDPEKRNVYDRQGLEGVASGGAGGMKGEELFNMFFNSRSQRPRSPRKGEDVNHPLQLTLEDLYESKTFKLAVNRQVLVEDPKICIKCDGRGHVVELRQIALGMVQQLQHQCQDCVGEGYKCKTTMERKILEVHVEKGAQDKEKIVFRGMADQKPNMEAGNVNFIIQELEHSLFKRRGADLLIRKTLSLNESLCGFEWKIKHLDAREIIIKSKPGEVIRALADNGRPFVKKISGEGMPSKGNPFIKGDLYVVFTVEFPKDGDLNAQAIQSLRAILPNPSMQVEHHCEKTEVVNLEPADVRNFGKGGAGNPSSIENEDESQPVQCQQS
mmetsp:Transcript_29257/g.44251  ORF Transcript_29257/g.44251 Transcript_29257/m.44251 type:complete len:403 (-) Transcript_29257:114-1322(-)